MGVKRELICVAVVALLGGPLAADARSINDPADVKAITAIENDLQTLSSMKELIQYYAKDAVVYDMYTPGDYHGTKQIYAAFESQFAQSQGFTGKIVDLNIVGDGKLACAALQAQFHYKQKDGKEGDLTVRALDAFKKTGGKWLIVQEHISMPTDPKTGMGIFNGHMPMRGPLAWDLSTFKGPAVTRAQGITEIKKWLDVGVLSPDVDALMKYYGPTDDVLVYDVMYPPGEFRGMKETRAGFAPVMNYTAPKVNMLDLAVDSDGLLGIQIDVQDVSTKQKDGTVTRFMLRQSDCMRRVEGKWYSLFEALSMPIDPKTGKAVADPATFSKQ
jgi:ketosteroid isomerase-like protein